MVETISPVVHGGRTTRYWVAWTLHALGAVIAAAALGGLLGAAGAVLGVSWAGAGVAAVAAIAVVYSLRDLLSVGFPLPHLRRQVPEWWRTFFPLPLTSF